MKRWLLVCIVCFLAGGAVVWAIFRSLEILRKHEYKRQTDALLEQRMATAAITASNFYFSTVDVPIPRNIDFISGNTWRQLSFWQTFAETYAKADSETVRRDQEERRGLRQVTYTAAPDARDWPVAAIDAMAAVKFALAAKEKTLSGMKTDELRLWVVQNFTNYYPRAEMWMEYCEALKRPDELARWHKKWQDSHCY